MSAGTALPEPPERFDISLPLTKGEVYRFAVSPLKPLPDFLLIGAARAGTTSLYAYLTALPWISGPSGKELHFFSYRWHRGLQFYRSRFPLALQQRLAAIEARTRMLLGEASPSYLCYPYVAERAAKVLPHAKILVLLRNPIDRAYSFWCHTRRFQLENLEFDEALEREEARLAKGGYPADQADCQELLFSAAYHTYVRQGFYAEQLERWFAVYPREQVLVLGSEEFYAAPEQTMREVCAFLGTAFRRAGYPVLNSAPRPADAPRLAEATRHRLAEQFRPHNERLFGLLGRRFDWDT